MTRGASVSAARKPGAEPCFFYRHHANASVSFITVFFCLFLAALLTATPSAAGPVSLNDGELAGITAQAGVSINLNGTAKNSTAVMKFSDTETNPNWIELYNYTVDNATGTGFSFSTPGSDYSGTTAFDPNTLDVGTNDSGQTLVSIRDTSHTNPRWYKVGDFGLNCYSAVDSLYHYQSLGSINLDAVRMGPSVYRFGSQQTNNGMIFDYSTAISADALTYAYNTAPESLSLSGIHVAGSITGDVTNPANPSDPWVVSGTFKIGDIATTPAQMDVGTWTDSSGGTPVSTTSLFLSLPMAGSVGVENVNFGGKDLGPMIITDIQVHHLVIRIN